MKRLLHSLLDTAPKAGSAASYIGAGTYTSTCRLAFLLLSRSMGGTQQDEAIPFPPPPKQRGRSELRRLFRLAQTSFRVWGSRDIPENNQRYLDQIGWGVAPGYERLAQ